MRRSRGGLSDLNRERMVFSKTSGSELTVIVLHSTRILIFSTRVIDIPDKYFLRTSKNVPELNDFKTFLCSPTEEILALIKIVGGKYSNLV